MSGEHYYWCYGDDNVEESLKCGYCTGSYFGDSEYPTFEIRRAKQLKRSIYISTEQDGRVVVEEVYFSDGRYLRKENGVEV